MFYIEFSLGVAGIAVCAILVILLSFAMIHRTKEFWGKPFIKAPLFILAFIGAMIFYFSFSLVEFTELARFADELEQEKVTCEKTIPRDRVCVLLYQYVPEPRG